MKTAIYPANKSLLDDSGYFLIIALLTILLLLTKLAPTTTTSPGLSQKVGAERVYYNMGKAVKSIFW